MAQVSLKEKSANVFNTIKGMSGNFTAADVAAKLGILPIAVNGSINALVKKGLVQRKPATIKDAEGKDKAVNFIVVTAEGKSAQVTVEK